MKISAVVPIHDNEPTVSELYRRLSASLAAEAGGDYEIVFVNHGSRDHSWAALEALAWADGRVLAVDLARSDGADGALLCGFAHARGDRLVTLRGDLRDAPEEIPALLRAAESGDLDVVYGISGRERGLGRVGGAAVRLAFRATFGGGPRRLSPFRAVGARAAGLVAGSGRRPPSIDAELAWFAPRTGEVPVSPGEVARGACSLAGDLSLALRTVAAYTTAPLRAVSLAGAALALVGLLAGAAFALEKLVFDIPISGYASLIVAITVLGGAQLAVLGVLGGYVARIHAGVSGAPGYAVRSVARTGELTGTAAAVPEGKR